MFPNMIVVENKRVGHHEGVRLESRGPGTKGTLTVMTTHEGDSRSRRCDEPQVGSIEWWMDIIRFSKETILSL